MPGVVLPAAFASANLILYFGGFDTMWKIDAALVVGLLLFAIGAIRTGSYDFQRMVKPALWAPAWLAGMLIISLLGRYGDSQLNLLPEWVDLLVVIAFSIAVYYWALRIALPREDVQRQLSQDAHELIEI